jgi:hypothetical protein
MNTSVDNISGIGPAAAAALGNEGFSDLASLAGATVDQVASIRGFSEVRAAKVISAAASLLKSSSDNDNQTGQHVTDPKIDTSDKPPKGKNKMSKKKSKSGKKDKSKAKTKAKNKNKDKKAKQKAKTKKKEKAKKNAKAKQKAKAKAKSKDKKAKAKKKSSSKQKSKSKK